MDIQIFKYKESHLEELRVILNEYLSFISKELNIDKEHQFPEPSKEKKEVVLRG